MSALRHFLAMSLILSLTAGLAFPQTDGQSPSKAPPREASKHARVAGAILGGLAGFWIAGSLVDDDRSSDAEYATALLAGPAIGAIGGYFIGRAIDRRFSKFAFQVDPMLKQEIREQMVESEVRRLSQGQRRADDRR